MGGDNAEVALTRARKRKPVSTPEHRRSVLERLGAAWERAPELRLLQLVTLAVTTDPREMLRIDDTEAVEMVERYVEKRR